MKDIHSGAAAVVWDLDGTLVDSVADLATSLNLLADELGHPHLPLARVRSIIGDGATKLIKRAYGEENYQRDQLFRFLEIYQEHLLDRIEGMLLHIGGTSIFPLALIVIFSLRRRRYLLLPVIIGAAIALGIVGDPAAMPNQLAVRGTDRCQDILGRANTGSGNGDHAMCQRPSSEYGASQRSAGGYVDDGNNG